jgi:hypothetical protein
MAAMGQQYALGSTRLSGSIAPFADLADSVPHPSKNPIGDMKASVPSAAKIFCYTLAAERLTAGIRTVL